MFYVKERTGSRVELRNRPVVVAGKSDRLMVAIPLGR